ncbi:hypothetical protein D3C71_2159260 [compost metagenome]
MEVADCPAMDLPRNLMSPVFGFNRPDRVFSRVDLPAPLAPIRVTISPSRTSRLIPWSAWIAP